MIKKLWIVEKPSAAKDLVAGLCLAYSADPSYTRFAGSAGYYQLTSGDVVMPLAGHLLTSVRPSEYLTPAHAQIESSYQFERYSEFLPILPKVLKKVPRSDFNPKAGKSSNKPCDHYQMAAKLIKQAKHIVNAGDIDREGQLIVDELLEYLGVDPYGTKPQVDRFGTPSNIAADIAALVIKPLDRNGDRVWRDRCEVARARERVDYAWGMNLSMVGQVIHKSPRVSVGRAQTPVLDMVRARDDQIENFVPTKYFVPVITLADGTEMRWRKREDAAGTPGFDQEGRIIDERLAQAIVTRVVRGEQGIINLCETTKHEELPPLPFSLSTLQSACSKELGLDLPSIKTALDGLYLKHKAITYIGTDCRFLPESMHEKSSAILRSLGAVMTKHANGADSRIKSRAFNDAKLDEHFAIAPTGTLPSHPSEEERSVFGVVARRFVAQFYPNHVYQKTRLGAAFATDHFVSASKQVLQMGWRDVEGQEPEQDARLMGGESPADSDDDQEVLS